MSTNYYWHTNLCVACGRSDRHHIGKTACGWWFLFQAHDEDSPLGKVRSYADWQRVLSSDGQILDGYGQLYAPADFWAMVRSTRRTDWKNHHRLYPQRSFVDADGWPFSECDFT